MSDGEETMSEEQLNELMEDARRTWTVPPGADYDAMWDSIERESFGAGRRPGRAPSWRVFSVGMAAALFLGIGLGRLAAVVSDRQEVAAVPDSGLPPSGTFDRAATELLGRTAVLLTALPAGVGNVAASEQFARQATELLTSTRLLLDSPAAADARFKNLLEDLEMVLAQIAMLQDGRSRQEIDLITDALEERDVVPRIRSAVARFSPGD